MKIELPRTGAPLLKATIYHPEGVVRTNLTAEYSPTLEVSDKTYLVVVESLDAAGRVHGCWGYDRTQWLPYQPEYHNAKRLEPKKPEPKKPEPKKLEPKQESAADGANSQNDLPAEKPLD